MLAAVLRVEARLLGLMQDGAETAAHFAAHIGLVVDDDAGDGLLGVAPLDARFGLVDGEVFVLHDAVHP